MLSLLLLRHAKSSWDNSDLDDFDRPLNSRGLKAAPMVGKWIADQGLSPDLILCSGARRTRETLGLILPFMRGDQEIRVENEIYSADGAVDLLDRLHSFGKGTPTIMIIGHNPAMQDLVLTLSGTGDTDDLQQVSTKFPTASLAEIEFKATDWSAVSAGSGVLKNLVLPRRIE